MANYEKEREELRQQVELFHSLERLSNSVDFKRLILRGFCEREVIELNRQASHEITSEAKILKSQKAQAGPVLEAYLERVRIEGDLARSKIPELDALIAEDPDQED
jgi:hypothetical protein